jgi:hypothetical protein
LLVRFQIHSGTSWDPVKAVQVNFLSEAGRSGVFATEIRDSISMTLYATLPNGRTNPLFFEAHEIGHVLGLDDRYLEIWRNRATGAEEIVIPRGSVFLDKNVYELIGTRPEPGWEDFIMGNSNRPPTPEERSMVAAMQGFNPAPGNTYTGGISAMFVRSLQVEAGINTRSLIAQTVYWNLIANAGSWNAVIGNQMSFLAAAGRAEALLAGYEFLLDDSLPRGLLPPGLYFARAALFVGDVDRARALAQEWRMFQQKGEIEGSNTQ